MRPVYICGTGAVSPGGWGVAPMMEALRNARPLPDQPIERPGWDHPLHMRTVPLPPARPAFLAHPRLRRVSHLTQFAAAAALEAVAGLPEVVRRQGRLGVVFAMQSGPVQYATRFYAETIKDPATASPLLFPETVFSAPASHIAALLENVSLSYTVMGDPAAFLDAVGIAADWLTHGRVDACVVVGAEEFNWLHSDALWHFSHQTRLSTGSGALCLTLEPTGAKARLTAITDAFSYSAGRGQLAAARAMGEQLGSGSESDLLCDGWGGLPNPARAERSSWRAWPGQRISPKRVLGEGLMAAAAWQCVVAVETVAAGAVSAANVSLVGCNQQAIGARFTRPAA